MVATKTLLTAEEFATLPDTENRQELVRGVVVEMAPPGEEHGDLQAELGMRLRSHARKHSLGRVVGEVGFILSTHPDTVRVPDLAFISAARLPEGGPRTGYLEGAPDIAVEIVSPNDAAAEVLEKVREYLEAGSRLVWTLYPRSRSVVVHYPDGTSRTLREDDVLSGQNILAGFEVRVGDLFA